MSLRVVCVIWCRLFGVISKKILCMCQRARSSRESAEGLSSGSPGRCDGTMFDGSKS